MCTIERLLIKGVRSFSPNNETTLEFDSPLSLIVGHNGAGKTTIIECLKQVTTGLLPPNCRNGQSFIHDPKAREQAGADMPIPPPFAPCPPAPSAPLVLLRDA